MIKYSATYRSYDDFIWRIDISLASYAGTTIALTCVGDSACEIAWEPDTTDDPYSPFIKSTATINFYNDKGLVDIDELQNAQDTDFIVQVYRNSALFWQGFVIPDGIQEPMKAVASITLSCTDGLSLLDDMPFVNADNLPGTTSDTSRCPMNFIRLILFNHNNLGLTLPIHWTNSLKCTAFNDDMLVGQVQWGLLGEGWTSLQSPTPSNPQDGYVSQKCGYILGGIIKSIQGRLFQCEGRWVIRRINDIVSGSFTDNSITGDQGIMVVTTVTVNVNKTIGGVGYPFINENQLNTVRKGVKTCKTTYAANKRENLLPNGNQDMVSTTAGKAFYWSIIDGDTDSSSLSVPGIDGRSGSATDLINAGGGGSANTFTLVKNDNTLIFLPIDSYTLIKKLQFGFVFSPVNGFPYDSTTGIINYSTDPLKILIAYTIGADTFWLDEFAIWRDSQQGISIKIEGTKINDIISVDFNRNNAILIPRPPAELGPTDTAKILVSFNINDGQRYTVDYIYFTTDDNNDVFESTYSGLNTAIDERTLEISSSYGGYFVSNYMTDWYNSGAECYYTDGFYTGTLTGMTANAIMRFLYKSSKIYNGDMNVRGKNWSFDEIYTIDTLTGKKFLPLNATYNTEKCEVSLVAVEGRNDNISLSEKHYGSNDQTLSN